MRKQFVDSCEQMLANSENSIVILGDIGVHGFSKVATKFPSRVLNIGILEQSMVGAGAGISSVGIIPTIHTIAPFIVERALEQIKIDFAYQALGGNFVTVGASFDYAALGCTHHCPADVSILSTVPGMNIFIPGHRDEFKEQFAKYSMSNQLNYFRLSEQENHLAYQVEDGSSLKIKDGGSAVVIAVGPILEEVLKATSELDVEVHYLNHFIAEKELSFDTNLTGKPLILIEPYYSGRLLKELLPTVRMRRLIPFNFGIPTQFMRRYGSQRDQYRDINMDSESIKAKIEATFCGE